MPEQFDLVPKHVYLESNIEDLNSAVIRVTRHFELDIDTLINKDIASFKRQTMNESTEHAEGNTNSPPESLMDFQPLAINSNGLINIFNELRVYSRNAIAHPLVLGNFPW